MRFSASPRILLGETEPLNVKNRTGALGFGFDHHLDGFCRFKVKAPERLDTVSCENHFVGGTSPETGAEKNRKGS